MDKYKDCDMNVVDNLRGDYAFSASKKEIRVDSSLLKDVQNKDVVYEEAFLARKYYCDIVSENKKNKVKVSPTKVKSEALSKAKADVIANVGEERYNQIHNTGSKPQSAKPSKKDSTTQKPLVTEKISEDELIDEFDSDIDDIVSEDSSLKVLTPKNGDVPVDEINIDDSVFDEDL